MIVNYCKKCDKWRGDSKVCPECESKCVGKKLSASRGDFYFLEGIDEPLARVTRILQSSNKEGLNYWVAKQAVIAALENPLLSVSQAMAARFKVRDKAGQKGTDIHKMIENIGDGKPNEAQLKLPQIKAYEKWRKDMPHKTVETELRVYSLEHKYAGTLDSVIETNRKIILDWKTSKSLHDGYAVQLTAYKHALAEMRKDKSILDWPMAVLHLKDNGTYSFVEVVDEWEVFLAHLTIYKWQNN